MVVPVSIVQITVFVGYGCQWKWTRRGLQQCLFLFLSFNTYCKGELVLLFFLFTIAKCVSVNCLYCIRKDNQAGISHVLRIMPNYSCSRAAASYTNDSPEAGSSYSFIWWTFDYMLNIFVCKLFSCKLSSDKNCTYL